MYDPEEAQYLAEPTAALYAAVAVTQGDETNPELDSYVYERLARWMFRRVGQRKGRVEKRSHDRFVEMGLYRRGTVKYPAQATPRRSSLSRVQENCTHGLKGVCLKRAGYYSQYRVKIYLCDSVYSCLPGPP
ncbi:MAG: hypothetical protein ACLQU1_19295 [Bryobacteraceae bacterium]